VEIGPGFGVLTLPLAEKAHKVIAYEIEKKLEPYWLKKQKEFTNIEIIWGNALHQFVAPEKYIVLANLPYQITSPVIRMFLEAPVLPESMVFMVQHEVAERICAKPGDMSLLAISVQYYAAAEYLLKVPRTSFWPVPGVDSALLKITPFNQVRDKAFEKVFFHLVKAGFAARRKLLFKNLTPAFKEKSKNALATVFDQLGLDRNVRAQELSVEQWKAIARTLASL
jgi:16S rRNA (adenine1518-N6/adenine1519-N6)-dimethyltransferase